MSDLQQFKMPIIEDVNDIPSVPEDPTHPNASLFCQKYNDLIDAIESIEGEKRNNVIDIIYDEGGAFLGFFYEDGAFSVPEPSEGWEWGNIITVDDSDGVPGVSPSTCHGVVVNVDEFGNININASGKTPAGSFSFHFGVTQINEETMATKRFNFLVNIIIVPEGSGSG